MIEDLGNPKKGLKYYLAGPWFTKEQKELLVEVETTLINLGVDLFSPRLHKYSTEYAKLITNTELDETEKKIKIKLLTSLIFHKNLQEIRLSQYMVLLDKGLDTGTLFDLGVFIASHSDWNKKIVHFDANLTPELIELLKKVSRSQYINNNSINSIYIHNIKQSVLNNVQVIDNTRVGVYVDKNDSESLLNVILLGILYESRICNVKLYIISPNKSAKRNIMLSHNIDGWFLNQEDFMNDKNQVEIEKLELI